MGAAYFYHLTRKPLEQTLPLLLGKALGAGWRCQVISPHMARLEALDRSLWLGDAGSFVPHGLAGGEHDAEQPVLLATAQRADPAAQCLMYLDGAQMTAQEVTAAERACILFDGNDDIAVQAARVQWKTLTDAGCAAQYWSEESGSWQKKAEKSAS